MLHYTVLFVSVGLVSPLPHHGGDDCPTPKWSSTYKVDGELHYPLAEIMEPLTIWVDIERNMSRMDVYGGTNRNYFLPSKRYPGSWDQHLVFPLTTETELNKITCSIIANSLYYTLSLGMLPDVGSYKYVGDETLFGKEASKWQLIQKKSQYACEHTMWVTHEMDPSGQEWPVPLRYEFKEVININQSRVTTHLYVDYFNYETKQIDEGVFKVNMTCDDSTENHPTAEHHFNDFKIKHGKQYTSEEEHEQRLFIFRHNLRNIEAHNRAGRGYKLAVNHLADRTPGELAAMTGLLPSGHPVGDQARCRSCWAFSVVGAVEGALRLRSRRPVQRLSEQALIDCTWGQKNLGCYGGYVDRTFDWVKKHGLPRYLDYGGYLGQDGFCHRDNVTDMVTINDYVRVPPRQADALRLAIFKHGPVSVTIFESFNFRFYDEGIYRDAPCINGANHAVLAIGYGILDGQKYWLVKNSYGSQWGNQGYILMAADENTACILNEPIYVTINK